jgi:hypothetical protein
VEKEETTEAAGAKGPSGGAWKPPHKNSTLAGPLRKMF